MHRVCLDTESNFYWDSTWGWATPDAVRRQLASQDIRLDAAVVYDFTHRKFYEYRSEALPRLLDRLSDAEEIITVNGSGCDLPVLERVCGQHAIKRLWSVHRDLHGWRGCYGVEELSNRLRPGRWMDFKTRQKKHCSRLRSQEVDEFLASKIAKCRTDVEYTAAVVRMIPANDTWRNKDERG